jgi:hypothetical protein
MPNGGFAEPTGERMGRRVASKSSAYKPKNSQSSDCRTVFDFADCDGPRGDKPSSR